MHQRRRLIAPLVVMSLLAASSNSHAQSRYDQIKAQVQAKARANANASQVSARTQRADIYKKIGPFVARGRLLASSMVYTCGDEIHFPTHRLKVLGQPLNWKNLYKITETFEVRKSSDSKRLNTGIVESIFVSIKWNVHAKDKRIVWWDFDTNQWGWGDIVGRFGRIYQPDGSLSEAAIGFTVNVIEDGSYKLSYGDDNLGLLPSERYFNTGPSFKQKKLHYIFEKFIEGSAPFPNLFKNECPPSREVGYNAYRGLFDFVDSEKLSLAGVHFDAEMARRRLSSKTPPKVKGNPALWVTTNDYPAQAIQQGMAGKVGFKLVVDRDGRASACTITQSSGWSTLDQATCALVMRRARFDPALDGLGEPTTGEYNNFITWWGGSE